MKKILLILVLIGLFTENIFCMQKDQEESKEQRENSDMEIDQIKDIEEDSFPQKAKGAKRTHTTLEDENEKEQRQKLPKKSNKRISLRAKKSITTPLIQAVKNKEREKVQVLIEAGEDVTGKDGFDNTALVYAAEIGDLELIKIFHAKNKEEQQSTRALIVASACGHREITEFLLAKDVQVNSSERGSFLASISSINEETLKKFRAYKVCPLIVASYCGHTSLVELLLNNNAHIDVRRGTVVPLTAALERGHDDIVELVLKRGASIELKYAQLIDPLICAIQYNREKWVKELLSRQQNKDKIARAFIKALKCDHDNFIPLFLPYMTEEVVLSSNHWQELLITTAQAGKSELLDALLEKIKDKKPAYLSALLSAIEGNQIELAEKLIKLDSLSNNFHVLSGTYVLKPLQRAVEAGHAQMVKLLFQAGIPIDDSFANLLEIAKAKGHQEVVNVLESILNEKHNNERMLLEASAAKNIVIVQKLLNQGIHSGVQDQDGITALMYAVRAENKEIVELLVKAGAPINARNKNGGTALSSAIGTGNKTIVTLLLNAGAQIDSYSLAIALQCSHIEILELIIDKSANKQKARNEALGFAALLNKPEYIRKLIEQGADVNARNSQNKTPLLIAAEKGHEKCVQLLLEAKADVTLQDDAKLDALAYAKNNGHETIVRMFEQALSDKLYKQRAFLEAAKHGEKAVIEELLKQGIDKNNVQDAQGNTALICAVANGHTQIVDLLLKENVEINSANKKNETALTLAVRKADRALVQALIAFPERIALPHLERSLRIAAYRGLNEIVTLLTNAHSNKIRARACVLYAAVEGRKKELIEGLIKEGVDINTAYVIHYAISSPDVTPLMFAVVRNLNDMVKWLLNNGARISAINSKQKNAFSCAIETRNITAFTLFLDKDYRESPSGTLTARITGDITPILSCLFLSSKLPGLPGFLQSLNKQKYEEMMIILRFLSVQSTRDYLKNSTSCCSKYIRVYKEERKCTRSELQQTPLMWACMFGHTDIVQQLIDGDMPHWFINAQDTLGRTALHYAVLYGHNDCAQILIKWYLKDEERIKEVYKSDQEAQTRAIACSGINLSDNEGNTVLFYAVTRGDLLLVNDLLKINAKLSTDKRKAALALKIAAANGWKEIVIRILFKLKDLPAIFK